MQIDLLLYWTLILNLRDSIVGIMSFHELLVGSMLSADAPLDLSFHLFYNVNDA